MADTSLERQVKVRGGMWAAVRRLDQARRGLPYVANDPLEMAQLVTATGTRWDGVDLDEAEDWLARRPDDRLVSGFVRWTSDGQAAGPGNRVVAFRMGSPAMLYLRGQDEAAVEGVASRLVAVIEQPGVSTRSGPPANLPDLQVHPGSGRGAERTQGRSRIHRFVQHPVASGTIAQVLGGLILVAILALGAVVLAHLG